ncbi:hypothetical protein KVT40_001400 [Elsinoe batatas]|uniref:BRCT domain-containing protein n=1 Tax=Elsinoe batatas TaxID=2601811 RepID=A0A8K0L8M6_9PEZI|nr:hypothetical protein KVT40_001400 [Elsinoe batatas]
MASMNWRFFLTGNAASQEVEQPIPGGPGAKIRLVLDKDDLYILTVGLDPDHDLRECYGNFDIKRHGTISFQPFVDNVRVTFNPSTMAGQVIHANLSTSPEQSPEYHLLRSGDEITFPDQEVAVRFEWDVSRVEVSSSAPVPGVTDDQSMLADGPVPATLLNGGTSVGEAGEETDAEDDDLDAGTAVLPAPSTTLGFQKHSPESQQHLYSTAQTSSAQLVQDTPVTTRVLHPSQLNGLAAERRAASPIPAKITSTLEHSVIAKSSDEARDEMEHEQTTAPGRSREPSGPPDELPEAFRKRKPVNGKKGTYAGHKKRPLEGDAELEPDEDTAPPPAKKSKRERHAAHEETPGATELRSKRNAAASSDSTSGKSRTKALKKEWDVSESPSPSTKNSKAKGKKASKISKTLVENGSELPTGSKSITVVFSSSKQGTQSNQLMLKKLGVEIKDDIDDDSEHYICTNPTLKSTGKILLALVRDQPIISDTWVDACRKAKALVEPAEYQIQEQKNIEADRSRLFSGKKVVFTQSALTAYGKDGRTSIERILTRSGGQVGKKAITKNEKVDADTIVIGAEDGDTVASALLQKDVVVYRKELIPKSIIEAELHIDNEDMMIGIQEKGGKRKSKG